MKALLKTIIVVVVCFIMATLLTTGIVWFTDASATEPTDPEVSITIETVEDYGIDTVRCVINFEDVTDECLLSYLRELKSEWDPTLEQVWVPVLTDSMTWEMPEIEGS